MIKITIRVRVKFKIQKNTKFQVLAHANYKV